MKLPRANSPFRKSDEAAVGQPIVHLAEEHAGEEHQRLREDDRHDAAVIHAKREILAAAAVHPAAARMLGLLNRNATLRLRNQDRTGNDEDEREDQEDDMADVERLARIVLGGLQRHHLGQHEDGVGHAGNDAGEDEQGDAVAQAVFIDLFAEPHQENAARRERGEGHEPKCNLMILHDIRLHEHRLGVVHVAHPKRALHDTQWNGGIARPFLDFALARLPFLLQLFQGGNDRAQELENNRRRDVRHDAKAEDRALLEAAAGENRDVIRDPAGGAGVLAFALLLGHLLECLLIHAGKRDVKADTINGKHEQGEEHLVPQLGHAKDVEQRLEHTITPSDATQPVSRKRQNAGKRRRRGSFFSLYIRRYAACLPRFS